MHQAARQPAGEPAGAADLETIGRPFYHPEWGRWLVCLGNGSWRTATSTEVMLARQDTGPAESRITNPNSDRER